MNYSDSSKDLACAIAGLRLYDSPIQEKGDNRVFMGSILLEEPIDLNGTIVKAIRIQDWQLEQLVSDNRLSSDVQLAGLLDANIFDASTIVVSVHTRTVGETYKGSSKSAKSFTIEPNDEKGLVKDSKVYSTEIEVSNMPLSLSERASEYITSLRRDAELDLMKEDARERRTAFKASKLSRLERLSKRFKIEEPEHNDNLNENNDAKALMQEQLDLLLEVPSPTTVQKKEIAELKARLASM